MNIRYRVVITCCPSRPFRLRCQPLPEDFCGLVERIAQEFGWSLHPEAAADLEAESDPLYPILVARALDRETAERLADRLRSRGMTAAVLADHSLALLPRMGPHADLASELGFWFYYLPPVLMFYFAAMSRVQVVVQGAFVWGCAAIAVAEGISYLRWRRPPLMRRATE